MKSLIRHFLQMPRGDKALIINSACFRALLVCLDLLGLALIGIAASLATGTVTAASSTTSKIVTLLENWGIQEPQVGIAAIALIFFLFRGGLGLMVNFRLANSLAQVEAEKSTQIQRWIINSTMNAEHPRDQALIHSLMSSSNYAFSVVPNSISIIMGEAAMVFGVGIYLGLVDFALFACLAVYFFVFAILLNLSITKTARKIASTQAKAWLDANEVANETVINRRFFRLSGRSKFVTQKFSADRLTLAESFGKSIALTTAPRYVIEFALMLGLSTTVLLSFIIEDFSLATGVVAIFLAGAFRLVTSVLTIHGSYQTAQQAMEQGAEAFKYFQKAQISENDEVVNISDANLDVEMEVNNCSYRYPGATRNVLNRLSFQVKSGDFLGIDGKSGKGKSTLIDLLTGLIEPTEGSVTLNGLEVREFLSKYPNAIGLVPQDTHLMNATLEQNVTLQSEPLSLEQQTLLSRVLKISHVDEMLANSEITIQTMLEGGKSFVSGGQAQRIGLARALYQNPSILILDEPTSNLDPESERAVFDALEKLRGSLTIIVISHSPILLKKADRILTLS